MKQFTGNNLKQKLQNKQNLKEGDEGEGQVDDKKKVNKLFQTMQKVKKKNAQAGAQEIVGDQGAGNTNKIKKFMKKQYKSVFTSFKNIDNFANRQISFFSKLLFCFVITFFNKVNKLGEDKHVGVDDLPQMDKENYLQSFLDKFESKYDKHLFKHGKPSLKHAIIKTFKWDIFVASFYCIFHVIANLAKVYFLRELLIKLYPVEESYENIIYLFLTMFIDFFAKHQYQFRAGIFASKIRSAIAGILYRKILTLRTSESQNLNSGKIMNILTVQMGSFEKNFVMLFTTYMSPFTFPLTIVGIYYIMEGVSGFMGIAYCILVVIITKIISKISVQYRKKKTGNTDNRINITGEIMEEIRFAKMQGFEQEVKKEIIKLRDKEVYYALIISSLESVCKGLISSLKWVASFVTFMYYIYVEERQLVKAQIFSALLLISFVNHLVKLVYSGFIFNVTMTSLFGRINSILSYDESDKTQLEELTVIHESGDNKKENVATDAVNSLFSKAINKQHLEKNMENQEFFPVNFENFTAQWIKEEMILNQINLKIPQGKLSMLVGRTACGKSTLLKSIIDEVPIRKGLLRTKGRILFVEQEPKIITGTIRDNIILDSGFDESKYKKVLQICRLEKDVAFLKDDSHLGERGSTLSWGQKQKICLARAAYQDADIYIFDDPFAVLDTTMSKKIFEDLMCQHFKGKTIIMATHILTFALKSDNIIIVEKTKIEFNGSLQELEKQHGNLEQYFLKNNLVSKIKTKNEEKKQKIQKIIKQNRIFGKQIQKGAEQEKAKSFNQSDFLNLFSKQDKKHEDLQEDLKKHEKDQQQNQAKDQMYQDLLDEAQNAAQDMDMQEDQAEMHQIEQDLQQLQEQQQQQLEQLEQKKEDENDEQSTEDDQEQKNKKSDDNLQDDEESIAYNKNSDDDDDGDDSDDNSNKNKETENDKDKQKLKDDINRNKQNSQKNNDKQGMDDSKSKKITQVAPVKGQNSEQDKSNNAFNVFDVDQGEFIDELKLNQNQNNNLQNDKDKGLKLNVSVKNVSQEEDQKSPQNNLLSGQTVKVVADEGKQELDFYQRIESSAAVKPNLQTYKTYGKACRSWNVVILLILFISAECSAVVVSRTYAYLKEVPGEETYSKEALAYFLIYFVSGNFLLSFIKSFYISFTGNKASTRLHNNMIQRVMSSKITFFMKTSLGNIMNRFSNDIGVSDGPLPGTYFELLELGFKFSIYVIFVAITNYYIVIAGFGASILFLLIFKYCVKGIKDVAILELITVGPVNTLFQETLDSITTIRVYKIQKFFEYKVTEYIDVWTKTNLASWEANRFLQFYGDLISIIFTCSGISLLVFLSTADNSGLISVSIEMLLAVTDSIQYIFRHAISLNSMMTSIARIKSYLELPQEGQILQKKVDLPLMKKGWPSEGHIVFDNVWFRPSPDMEYRYKGLNFTIQKGENVAVLGKSGTGKSTLFNLILRLFEVDKSKNSKILIDDVDISNLGLRLLRRSITYIPQFPTLFEATLRRNIDPFEFFTDGDIWSALRQFDLEEFVQNLPLKLDEFSNDHEVSVGKRQLLFFAKAYLYKSKIILFDEPSANFDIDTEQFLKQKIKEEFWHYTIITIAHRLLSIADYDKIIILNDGVVEQIGHPFLLLVNDPKDKQITKSEGIFQKMLQKEEKIVVDEFFKLAKLNYLKTKQIKKQKNKISALNAFNILKKNN